MTGKTYIHDELFKMSEKWEPTFDGLTITIDNFYENPEAIHDFIMNRQFPMWKYSTERKSLNGIEYNDCRIVDKIGHPTRKYFGEMERLLDICRKHFHKGRYDWDLIHEFNVFQTITEFDNKMQHYPHTDSSFDTPNKLATLNMLVYLDKQESGGTAVYNGEWISNDEHHGLLYPCQDEFELNTIIPAKFNRCVIFPGNRLHGAHIEDYTKYSGDNWRVSQVQFFHPTTGNNHAK